MPAVDENQDPLVPVTPPSVTPSDLEYQGIANDTALNSVEQLYTHVPGMRWIVDVYSQVLNRDDETRPLEPQRLEINQQYKLITQMELKVTTPIPQTPTLDDVSQEFEVTGEANVYPNTWIPNQDDHIVGTLPDGRKGLFKVTGKPKTLSIFTKPGYTISFVLSRWLSAEDSRALARRTVETYVYVRDRVGSGINPLVVVKDYQLLEQLASWHARIPELYITWFFNKEYATLTVPNQPATTYDPFHAYFIQALFPSYIAGVMTGLYHIPVMDAAEHGYQTFWDLLLTMDPERINGITPKIPVINTSSFIHNPYMHSVRYSGMRCVVYPIDPNRLNLGTRFEVNPVVTPLAPGMRPAPRIRTTLAQLFPGQLLPTPYEPTVSNKDIKLVTYDDAYVLSEDFYAHNTANLSTLEKLVWDGLETGIVSVAELLRLIKASEQWSDLEKFYYIPILCALIPAAERSI